MLLDSFARWVADVPCWRLRYCAVATQCQLNSTLRSNLLQRWLISREPQSLRISITFERCPESRRRSLFCRPNWNCSGAFIPEAPLQTHKTGIYFGYIGFYTSARFGG